METLSYKRINWQIELINLLIIVLEVVLALQKSMFSKILPGLVVQVCTYLLLSLIYYFISGPKVLLPKSKTVVPVKMKDISEQEALCYIKRGILYFNSTKLAVSSLIASNMLMQIFNITSFFSVSSFVILLSLFFYLTILFTKCVASAKGYVLTSNKELIRNFIFYYNPEDKRSVVDKPLGMGSTINLATKDGKMIIGVILAIPVAILTMLLIALALAGKL